MWQLLNDDWNIQQTIFLLLGQFGVICYNPFFCKCQGLFMSAAVGVSIWESVHTFLYAVQYFPFFILYIYIIVFQKDPGFFCFRQCFHGFGKDISVPGFGGMADVVQTVKSLISYLNCPAGYVISLF